MLSQQQLKLQRDYFKELVDKQKLSNKTIHDAKNQLYAITAHLNSGEIEYVTEKMNELCSNILNTISISNTGNDALDALINSKYKKINEIGAEFTTNIFMGAESGIDDVDLCILIGNALDNAIEACERINDGDERWIKLKIAQIDDNLSMELTNTSSDNRIVKNSALPTMKKDKYFHGFGLKSMEEITKKYHGYIEYAIENKIFILKILIPNNI
jgi:sensor histidine kinase regulating citrate/malate metabolism